MTMDQQAAMERLQDLYREKNEYLEEFLEWITPYEFYREVFPVGSFERRGLQRHPAALADQLPRRAQQRVDGDIKQPGKLLQCLRIRRGLAVFPAGHRLSGDKQLLRQLIL